MLANKSKKLKKSKSKKPSLANSSSSKSSRDGIHKSEKLSDTQKETFLLKIKTLEDNLKSYSDLNKELENSVELLNKNEEIINDKNDIITYLEHGLKQKDGELKSTRMNIEEIEKKNDEEKQKLETRISELESNVHKLSCDHSIEKTELLNKIESLKNFEVEKVSTEREIAELKNRLSQQERLHEENMYSVECQTAIYRERLREEQLESKKNLERELKKETLQKMNETAKYSVKENSILNTKMESLKDDCQKLENFKDDLHMQLRCLREKNKILQISEKNLIAKNIKKLKKIEELRNKCAHLEQEADNEKIATMKYKQTSIKLDEVEKQAELKDRTMQAIKEHAKQINERMKFLAKKLDSETNRRAVLEEVHRGASKAILEVILTDENDPDFEVLRSNLLNHLLNILNVRTIEQNDSSDTIKSREFDDGIVDIEELDVENLGMEKRLNCSLATGDTPKKQDYSNTDLQVKSSVQDTMQTILDKIESSEKTAIKS